MCYLYFADGQGTSRRHILSTPVAVGTEPVKMGIFNYETAVVEENVNDFDIVDGKYVFNDTYEGYKFDKAGKLTFELYAMDKDGNYLGVKTISVK